MSANYFPQLIPIQLSSSPSIHKAMAGNIIPAIATTNAIIAGVIVMESLKILDGCIKECKMVRIDHSHL